MRSIGQPQKRSPQPPYPVNPTSDLTTTSRDRETVSPKDPPLKCNKFMYKEGESEENQTIIRAVRSYECQHGT